MPKLRLRSPVFRQPIKSLQRRKKAPSEIDKRSETAADDGLNHSLYTQNRSKKLLRLVENRQIAARVHTITDYSGGVADPPAPCLSFSGSYLAFSISSGDEFGTPASLHPRTPMANTPIKNSTGYRQVVRVDLNFSNMKPSILNWAVKVRLYRLSRGNQNWQPSRDGNFPKTAVRTCAWPQPDPNGTLAKRARDWPKSSPAKPKRCTSTTSTH